MQMIKIKQLIHLPTPLSALSKCKSPCLDNGQLHILWLKAFQRSIQVFGKCRRLNQILKKNIKQNVLAAYCLQKPCILSLIK